MAKVITVANQKGGVGKTTTTASLAFGLSKSGMKVLAIDADPQGSLTTILSRQNPDGINDTLADILEMVVAKKPVPAEYAVMQHPENVNFIPANVCLASTELKITGVYARERLLRMYIQQIRDRYDVIIIDSSPTLSLMTINALVSADSVVIPTQAEHLSTKGFEQLFDTISQVRLDNPELQISGILVTMADTRINSTNKIIARLQDDYGDKVFRTIIPRSCTAPEAAERGTSIFSYKKPGDDAKVATAYKNFTDEIKRSVFGLKLQPPEKSEVLRNER